MQLEHTISNACDDKIKKKKWR